MSKKVHLSEDVIESLYNSDECFISYRSSDNEFDDVALVNVIENGNDSGDEEKLHRGFKWESVKFHVSEGGCFVVIAENVSDIVEYFELFLINCNFPFHSL